MCVQIAIFLVGLTTPATAPLVIPSLVRHVIQVWGPESVDFFVHTSPLHSMAMNGSDVVDLYEMGLRQQFEELRVDSADGNAYPLKYFREFYGDVSVCLCVCVSVCLCVCVCAIYIYIIYICIYILCIYMSVCVYIRIYYIYVSVCIYIRIYISNMYMYICVSVCVYIRIYYIYVSVCRYIRIYIYIYIYAYIFMYILCR